MKAYQFSAYGGPEVLRLVEVEDLPLQRGEIRIAVMAAGVNPSDWKRREGQYQAFETVNFPLGLGVEASGTIVELGGDVAGFRIGDAVFGYGDATMAQRAVLIHWVAKPAALPFDLAGGLPVVFETAYRALEDARLREGDTLLVSGGAGGIGTAIIQVARRRGATVIATASAGKHDYLRSFGALPTTYGDGLTERVAALSPDGVDVAVDVVGSGILPELITITGDARRVVSVADFAAAEHGAVFSKGPPRHIEAVLAEVAQLCVEGVYRMPLEIFPFADAVAAQEVSAGGRVTGKLVVHVG